MSDEAHLTTVWIGWSGFPSEGGSITGAFADEVAALEWLNTERRRDIAEEVKTAAFWAARDDRDCYTPSETGEIEHRENCWMYRHGMDVRSASEWPVTDRAALTETTP
jgi:hypothetical protein